MFNNAKIANRYWDPKIGVLAEGCRRRHPHGLLAAHSLRREHLPGTPGLRARSRSWTPPSAGGKVLMERKKLKINLDEEEIAAKSLELARKL